jgi:ATP-dependent DNA helicase RecG
MNKAKHYIDELNDIDEHVNIEAKQCSDKIDKSVLETVCSFSNEPGLGGGTIIIGLQESEDSSTRYKVVGVNDVDKLQKDLATQCANMFNHPVRPFIEPEIVDGKKVIVVEVQELDSRLKPLYFRDTGLPKGAWRRIGSTDHRCTEEDLHVLFHEVDDFDVAIANGTDLDDIDENAVRAYRRLRTAINPKAEELNYSDIDLLRSLHCIVKDKEGEWKLTNTGLLVFGTAMALRRELPAVRVDYIRVTGTEWLPDPHNRFDSIDMRGPLLLMVSRAFNAIADDMPRGFSLKPGNLQADRPLSIPDDALREAIVNSLIHQDFRIHQPIQIIRYSNRIEIINPGFSLKPAETLGEPGSRLRNPTISSIFHETQLAEAKGTGIGTMRRLMKDAAMMPPTFESDYSRNTFTTRMLLHHFLSGSDVAWFATLGIGDLNDAQKVALIFLREVGAIDNITYRQLSGSSAKDAGKGLKALANSDLIAAKGQGRQTYYVPTDKLKSLYAKGACFVAKGASFDAKGACFVAKDASFVAKDASFDAKDVCFDANGATSKKEWDGVPDDLRERIKNLGTRASKAKLYDIIVELCRIKPRSKEELANILGRTEIHIRNKILPGLLKSRLIRFTIPEMKKHPNQKYTATK